MIKKLKKIFKVLGPGLITGASDDDPSGIATYSQAGAQFGFATLWLALLSFPLMMAMQEMCARIGLVTRTGLVGNLIKYYPKFILYLVMLLSFPAIILNIAADLAGMGAVAHLILPMVPVSAFTILFTFVAMFLIIKLSYEKIAAILKYCCISLLLYLIVPFLVKQNWLEVLRYTFVPHIQSTKVFLSIVVAILGTTISPYLFFWQATMEAEHVRHQSKLIVGRNVMREMKIDVGIGMFFSNIVMYFIILTTGSILFKNGIQHVTTVEQAAKALEPLAGHLSYFLFALGVLGTGFLTIPILSGALSYMLSATFKCEAGLDKKWSEAPFFYSILIVSLLLGLGIDFLNINPIQALIFTAILYGLTAPIIILIILLMANNKKIMGKFKNGKWSNLFGSLTFILMLLTAILLLYLQFSSVS